MARKNISDLLRQEAQKNPNSEDETAKSNEKIIDVSAVEAVEVTAEEVNINVNDKTSTKRSSSTNGELETTVAQLQAALDRAKENEASLQKEIGELRSHLIKSQQNEASLEKKLAELRSEVESQKKLLKQQEQKLEKTNQMKKELDEAKKTSLQLANANSAIEEEIKELRKKAQAAPAQAAPAPAPTSAKLAIKKEGKFLNFPSQTTGDPTDFASNTWLLD